MHIEEVSCDANISHSSRSVLGRIEPRPGKGVSNVMCRSQLRYRKLSLVKPSKTTHSLVAPLPTHDTTTDMADAEAGVPETHVLAIASHVRDLTGLREFPRG